LFSTFKHNSTFITLNDRFVRAFFRHFKQEPGNPTLTHLKALLGRQVWFQYQSGQQALADIPDVKIQHFAAEARTFYAVRMLEIKP